jgi:hypothetical protein
MSPPPLSFPCLQELLMHSPPRAQGYSSPSSCPFGAQLPRWGEAARSQRRRHPNTKMESSSQPPQSFLRPSKAGVNNIHMTKSSHITEVEGLAGNAPWSCIVRRVRDPAHRLLLGFIVPGPFWLACRIQLSPCSCL